jgi:putative membrane protein
VSFLPELNALLNGASAVLLIVGYGLIRRGRVAAHRACMLTAFGLSVAFLASYLYYHVHVGVVRFPGRGWIRAVYFSILVPHTICAVMILPLVLITLSFALRGRFDRHKRIARWTLPIWLFVSVTGVVVYWMLYRMEPGAVPSGVPLAWLGW